MLGGKRQVQWQRSIHGLGDESSEDLLLADGIDVKNIDNKDQEATQQALQSTPALQRAKQANLKIL